MKKLTVYIKDETYEILNDYCHEGVCGRLYFKNVVDLAIRDYCSKNTANFFSNNTAKYNHIEKDRV